MKKGSTSFRKKIKTVSQIITTTIPTTAALLIMITVLTGTMTTAGVVVNVWAGTFPGPNGQIAFVRGPFEEHEFDEIYVMNSDGSRQTQLTVGGGSPSWSPDGEKIAFQSHRDVNPDFAGPEIYVMNAADGSDVTRLTDNDSNDFSPDWGTNTSPPGSGPNTPAQLIDKLTSTIQNLDDDNVPQSVKTSLTELLKGVSQILNDDNPNNDKAACGMLDAFIKLVNANERLNMLTADQADNLRTQAEDIRSELLDC